MRTYLAAFALVLLAAPVSAAYLQYKTDSGEVVGISDSTIGAVSGHAVIRDDRFTKDDYPWPAPPGCLTGRLLWTRVVTANPLALGLKANLVLFACEEVSSGEDVDAVVARRVNASTAQQTAVELDDLLSALRIIVRECPALNTSQDCRDKREAANSRLDSAKPRQEDNEALRKDAARFKREQGW